MRFELNEKISTFKHQNIYLHAHHIKDGYGIQI